MIDFLQGDTCCFRNRGSSCRLIISNFVILMKFHLLEITGTQDLQGSYNACLQGIANFPLFALSKVKEIFFYDRRFL